MSAREPGYEEQRTELLESIEHDQDEVRGAARELASVASEQAQEMTTVATGMVQGLGAAASDKVQELTDAASDKVQQFTDAASDKLDMFDVGERVREFPVRWLLVAFAAGAYLGARSQRPIVFTQQRSLR